MRCSLCIAGAVEFSFADKNESMQASVLISSRACMEHAASSCSPVCTWHLTGRYCQDVESKQNITFLFQKTFSVVFKTKMFHCGNKSCFFVLFWTLSMLCMARTFLFSLIFLAFIALDFGWNECSNKHVCAVGSGCIKQLNIKTNFVVCVKTSPFHIKGHWDGRTWIWTCLLSEGSNLQTCTLHLLVYTSCLGYKTQFLQ